MYQYRCSIPGMCGILVKPPGGREGAKCGNIFGAKKNTGMIYPACRNQVAPDTGKFKISGFSLTLDSLVGIDVIMLCFMCVRCYKCYNYNV